MTEKKERGKGKNVYAESVVEGVDDDANEVHAPDEVGDEVEGEDDDDEVEGDVGEVVFIRVDDEGEDVATVAASLQFTLLVLLLLILLLLLLLLIFTLELDDSKTLLTELLDTRCPDDGEEDEDEPLLADEVTITLQLAEFCGVRGGESNEFSLSLATSLPGLNDSMRASTRSGVGPQRRNPASFCKNAISVCRDDRTHVDSSLLVSSM